MIKCWYSSSGEIFNVLGSSTHKRWVHDNKEMLKDNYGIKAKPSNMTKKLVGLGWARIIGNEHGVNVDVLENRIGNFLIRKFPQLWREGSDVVVIINNTELSAAFVQEHSSLVEAYRAGKQTMQRPLSKMVPNL